MQMNEPGGQPIRPYRRAALVALLAGLIVAAIPDATRPVRVTEPPAAIEIVAQPFASFHHGDPSRRRFGLLEFRGGLVLTSRFKEFGGLSSFRVAADGARFIAASDKGWWLKGRITYEGTRPTGIVEAEMAAMLGPDGRGLAARGCGRLITAPSA